MTNKTHQIGFSIVELIVAIAVVGLIGFVGYIFANRQTIDGNLSAGVPEAVDIKSSDDLSSAEKLLDGIDLDDKNDSAALDSQLSSF